MPQQALSTDIEIRAEGNLSARATHLLWRHDIRTQHQLRRFLRSRLPSCLPGCGRVLEGQILAYARAHGIDSPIKELDLPACQHLSGEAQEWLRSLGVSTSETLRAVVHAVLLVQPNYACPAFEEILRYAEEESICCSWEVATWSR